MICTGMLPSQIARRMEVGEESPKFMVARGAMEVQVQPSSIA